MRDPVTKFIGKSFFIAMVIFSIGCGDLKLDIGSLINLPSSPLAPLVTFTSPALSSFVGAAGATSVTISGTCNQNGRDVIITGAISTTAPCANEVFSKVVDMSAIADGGLTLYGDLSNAQGLQATQASTSFIKDTQAPNQVVFSSPASNLTLGATNYSFGWATTDNGLSDLKTANTYQIEKFDNGTCTGTAVATVLATPNTYNYTSMANATDYSVRVTAYDNAGNASNPRCSPTISVNTAAPTLALEDATTGSTLYVRQLATKVTIGNDASAAKWCLSESQTTAPASGAAACAGSGWLVTRPTTFNVSAGDGNKTIYVWVADAADTVIALTVSDTITLDTTKPADPVVSMADPNTTSTTHTNQSTVSLSITSDTDAVAWCVIEQANAAAAPAAPTWNSCTSTWATTRPTTQALGATGVRKIYVYTKDVAGNISNAASTATMDYSTTAPANPTLALTDATTASATYVRQVATAVAIGNDATAVKWCLSESQNTAPASGTAVCSGTGWLTSEPTTFNVSAGDGNKTVYVWIADAYNNVNGSAVSDSIVLDSQVPAKATPITLFDPTVSPNNNNTPTIGIAGVNIGDTVKIYTDSSCNILALKGSGTPIATSINITSAALTIETAYSYYAEVIDPAGNSSGCSTASVAYTYETTPPSDPTLALSDPTTSSASYVRQRATTIAIGNDTGIARWCVSESQTTKPATGTATCNGGQGSSSGWHTTEPTTFNVSSGDGLKTVYVWVASSANNVNANAVSAQITLDTVLPTGPGGSKNFIQISKGSYASCALAASGEIFCWGDNTNGGLGDGTFTARTIPTPIDITTLPAGTRFVQLSVGESFACALSGNGKVYCWGYDAFGQLGNGATTTTNQSRPVTVDTSNLTANSFFVQITMGAYHACGLADDGKAYCWGSDSDGQLGDDGVVSNKDKPTLVDSSNMTAGTRFIKLSAGSTSTCGLANDGKAYCWGDDFFGAVGDDGASTDKFLPTLVSTSNMTAGTHFVDLAIGWADSMCAIASDSKTYCWGNDSKGSVGNGAGNSNQFIPVLVDISNLTTGTHFTKIANSATPCGLTSDYKVYCWGNNDDGGLGNGTSGVDAFQPVLVDTSNLSTGTKFIDIASGGAGSCAITNDGKTFCWGSDGDGQLGDGGTNTNQLIPVAADMSKVTPGNNFIQISSSGVHTCGLTGDHSAYCWGFDADGQLGDSGTNTDKDKPTAVDMSNVTSGARFTKIVAGYINSCALASDGKAYCWGDDGSGQLGNDVATIDHTKPVAVSFTNLSAGENFIDIAMGYFHNCALSSNRKVYCWGNDVAGGIGNGPANNVDQPIPVLVDVSNLTGGASLTKLSLGNGFSCGISSDGKTYCWGSDTSGEIGDGTGVSHQQIPTQIDSTNITSGTITKIASSSSTSCAITSEGKSLCWGKDSEGQLGNDTTKANQFLPVTVSMANVTGNFQKLVAGDTSCGITGNGNAYCWGYNAYGQIGNGNTTDQPIPVLVNSTTLPMGTHFKDIATSPGHACGLTSAGKVQCWGLDSLGSVGDGGTNTNQPIPADTDLTNLVPNLNVIMTSQTTGSKLYTNSATVDVSITGDTDATRWCLLEVAGSANPPAAPLFNDVCFVTPRPTTTTLSSTGLRKIYVYTRDIALNVSQHPATAAIAYSTTAPANPSSWTMASPTNGATSVDYTPQFSDTGIADALNGHAYVYDAVGCVTAIGDATIDSSGNFSITNVAYASDGSQNGAKSFYGKIVDPYNNSSSCVSLSLGYTLATGGPTISIANVSVSEGTGPGNTYATFTITASANATQTLTVNYATSNGTATAGSDYTNTSGTATIAIGTASTTIRVPILRDSINENNETFTMTLAEGTNYTIFGSTLTASGTILNDEKKNFVQVSLGETSGCGIASDGNTYCWGKDVQGQIGNGVTTGNQDKPVLVDTTNLTAGSKFKQISVGGYHVCGVASDGKAYCWGYGAGQALGDGASTADQDKPVLVDTSNLTAGSSFVEITCGEYHSCGLASDGKAYCWGANTFGEIGDGAAAGTYVDKPYPIDISNMTAGSRFIQLTAGWAHTCGLASDGKAYCWGYNNYGELGTLSAADKPVAVVTTALTAGSSFIQLSAGGYHTCGIASDGKTYCWGLNSAGQVGSGNFTSQHNTPQLVSQTNLNAGSDFIQISAGYDSTCAVASDGLAYCWGADVAIGNWYPGNQNKPFAVDSAALVSGAKFISVYTQYGTSIGLTGGGLAYGWGYDDVGQAGNGDSDDGSSAPSLIDTTNLPNVQGMTMMQTGYNHACAKSSIGNIYCWGRDNVGQLGDDAGYVDKWIPTLIDSTALTSGSKPKTVTLGVDHSCLTADDGKTYCWGENSNDQIGTGVAQSNYTIATLTSLVNLVSGTSFYQIVAGGRFNFGVASDGKTYAWGIDTSGQLGDGGTNTNRTEPWPVDISSLTSGTRFTKVFTGFASSYGIANDGKVYAWGNDVQGQLGDGAVLSDKTIPTLVDTTNLTAGTTFTQISAGDLHACGVSSDGKAYCWGRDTEGELGDGAVLSDKTIPTLVDTTNLTAGSSFVKVSCGDYFSCGIASDGKAYCWGADWNGSLGDDATLANKSIPVEVDTSNLPAGSKFIDIGAGSYSSCGITDQYKVFCWGLNTYGQLGNGNTTAQPTPVQIDTSAF